ncbi:helix-turn-helix domain-containing protein [Clostridium akagii]|uniref:helix-turn-helix domain-containing protein n=1 Tax=Clostridium akagii TaxID=91623 RepID=UPI00068A3E9B|nr:helix-turn-helix domain-containing protein [Clostridium akagii]
MNFMTPGEKVRKLRIQLNLTQEDLQAEKLTRGLISMIETDRRDVTYSTAVKLAEEFNQKAEELNILMNIDEAYLMRSPKQDAEIYCFNRLKNEDITQSTIDEIFELISEYDLLEVKAKTYFKLGEISEDKKNYDEACINYDKAIIIYKDISKDKELGYVYLRLGSCKGKSLQHDTAVVYFNLSQYYSFTYGDKNTEGLSLYNLANAYIYLNKIDLALETVEKYLTISDKEDYYYNYGLNIKAQCYEAKENYDKAIEIYKSLLEKNLDNENPILGYVYNNLGLNYCNKNDFKESMKYFEMAEKFRSETDKEKLSHSLIEKSIVLLKQNLYAEAVKSIELGLKYAKNYNDLEYLIKGYYNLRDIYDKINDFENVEKVYVELIELLRTNGDISNLKSVYDKIALMYLKQGKSTLCEKYLLLSDGLN